MYFVNDNLATTYPHYHIVLNLRMKSGEDLYVAICTSKIERLKEKAKAKKYAEETIVYIETSEYAQFTKNTGIDCNDAQVVPADVLAGKKVCRYNKFPQTLLDKVLNGVLLSESVDEKIKAAIFGVELDELGEVMARRFGGRLKRLLPGVYDDAIEKTAYLASAGGRPISIHVN